MKLNWMMFALLALLELTAVAGPISCPDSVAVAVPPEAGWTSPATAELFLNSATPTSGPPDRHGDLTNFTRQQKKDGWTETYGLDRPFPDGKWLECGYGTHNEVTLSQPLAESAKVCTFTYRKGAKAGQRSIKIECR